MTSTNSGAQPQNRAPQSIGFLLLDNFTLISLASAVEPLVFGMRVADYQPAMLDELLASGEYLIAFSIRFHSTRSMSTASILTGGRFGSRATRISRPRHCDATCCKVAPMTSSIGCQSVFKLNLPALSLAMSSRLVICWLMDSA